MTQKRFGRLDFMIIVLAGFASQVFFHLTGGRFDGGGLDRNIYFVMQLLDPRLLAGKLAESLWYMHIQPPLYNFFVGIGLKLFPSAYALAFEAVYLLIGLALAWTIYRMMRLLGVVRWLALAVTILYQIGPADMFFRNWFFYSYPIMALLILAGYFMMRYLHNGGNTHGWLFFALIMSIVLTRVVYHPAWFAIITVGLMIMMKNRRRQITIMAAGPALIVFLWLAKNYYLFGSFSMNTQLGWSLAKIATQFLTTEEMKELQAEGKISVLAGIPANQRYEIYLDYMDGVETYWHPVDPGSVLPG